MRSQPPRETAATVLLLAPVLTPEKPPPYPPRYHGHGSGGAAMCTPRTQTDRGEERSAVEDSGLRNTVVRLGGGKNEAASQDASDSWLPVPYHAALAVNHTEAARNLFTGEHRTRHQPLPDRGQTSIRTCTWVRCGADTCASFTSAFEWWSVERPPANYNRCDGGRRSFFSGVFLWD